MSVRSSLGKDRLTLRQAALIAGITYLLNPVTYAEAAYPKLIIVGDIDQTVRNIGAHRSVFLAIIFSYFISFVGDIVLAWALFHLLAPVNRAVSLLAAWFQLIYAAMSLCGVLALVAAFNLVITPEYAINFGNAPLHAQVGLLLDSFRSDWTMGLILFGVHLGLLGTLIFRSSSIPQFVGILILIDGLGWMVNSLSTYLFPNLPLGYISITFLGEVVFMFWLLIRGWRIQELAA